MKNILNRGTFRRPSNPTGKLFFTEPFEQDSSEYINAAMIPSSGESMYLWARDIPDIDRVMHHYFGMLPIRYSNKEIPGRGLFGVDITYAEPVSRDRLTVKSTEQMIGYKIKKDGIVGSSQILGYKINSIDITHNDGSVEPMGNIFGEIAKIDDNSESYIKKLILDVPGNKINDLIEDMTDLAIKDIELKTKMPTYIYG